LPEKRLIELLKCGRTTLQDAQNQIEELAIALQWAKKNGWVSVTRNEILLIKEPESFPYQESLEKLSRGEPLDKDALSILLSRKLVEEDSKGKKKELIGKEVTSLTEDLIKTGLWREVKFRSYNVEVPGKVIYPGKRQPYNAFLNYVRQRLIELGFIEIIGSAIELEFWNFDALFQAQNHPARDWTQTYSLKYPKYGALHHNRIVRRVKASHENGWKTGSTGWQYKWDAKKASKLMPIAHDTALSPKTLSSKELHIPGKYFQIVRCYRPDVIDATHGVEFNQMGGFIVDKDLTFRDLLGLLRQFAELIGAEKTKFYSDYYPFTEPSCQISAKHPEMGWIEIAGAGIFRPELTEPLGVKEPVIAWGFGIDRLAMYALGINDIRNLFNQHLDWLRDHKVMQDAYA
jgi:phenylalanyl-tRNA synthetase alpha chain